MNRNRRRSQKLIMAAIGVAGLGAVGRAADVSFSWVGPASAAGSPNWTVTANWAGNVSPTIGATTDNQILVYGGTFQAANSTQNGPQSANPADYSLYQMVFNDFTLAGGGSLNLTTSGSASRQLSIGAGGILVNAPASGTININASSSTVGTLLTLTADQTWSITLPDSTNFIMKRPIAGSATLTKTGTGTLQFQPTSPLFTGSLNLQKGIIRFDATDSMANLGGLSNVSDDTGTIVCSGGVNETFACPAVLGGAGTLGFSGSGNATFSNSVTLTSMKRISQGTPRTLTFAGSIGGTGGINKLGTGFLIMNGTNSYSGDTQVSNGTLSINDFAQLGTATTPITLAGTTVGAGLIVRAADQTTSRGLVINPFGASLDFAGNLTINAPVTSLDTATGGLFKVGAGVLTTGSMRLGKGTLNAQTGAVVIKPDGTDAASNRMGALTLGGGLGAWTSKLDLNNNHLVIDYTGTSPLATVVDQIKSGYAGGAWTGPGITSGSAATVAASIDPHKTALAYIEASTTGTTSFAGQTVDGDAILIRYTLSGDANADGVVNAFDFNAVASNFGSATGQWFTGDFNYDGTVNMQDFNAVATNFNMSVAAGPGTVAGALVPEPAALAILPLVFSFAARRRRQGHASL